LKQDFLHSLPPESLFLALDTGEEIIAQEYALFSQKLERVLSLGHQTVLLMMHHRHIWEVCELKFRIA
jgi:hypothetical protein